MSRRMSCTTAGAGTCSRTTSSQQRRRTCNLTPRAHANPPRARASWGSAFPIRSPRPRRVENSSQICRMSWLTARRSLTPAFTCGASDKKSGAPCGTPEPRECGGWLNLTLELSISHRRADHHPTCVLRPGLRSANACCRTRWRSHSGQAALHIAGDRPRSRWRPSWPG